MMKELTYHMLKITVFVKIHGKNLKKIIIIKIFIILIIMIEVKSITNNIYLYLIYMLI